MVDASGPVSSHEIRVGPLFGTLLLISLLGAVNITIVGASLATIVGDLDGLEHIAWVVTAFALAGLVAMPIAGQLGDLWGRRGLFLVSVGLFVAGSLLCGLSATMLQLALARAVQGFGSAGVTVLAQAILADVVPVRRRASYVSLLGSVFGVATVAGPLIGGLLTDTLGWRWIFLVNVPAGLLGLMLAWRTIPGLPPMRTGRFDIVGAVLLGAGATALALLVTFGGSTWPWHSTQALVGATAMTGCLVAFGVVERRVRSPIVPFAMFGDRTVAIAMVLAFVTGAGMLSVVSYIPVFAQMRYATSATTAGAVPIAVVAGMILASNLSAVLIARTGDYRRYPIIGTALAAAALLMLAYVLRSLSIVSLSTMFGLVGLGTGAFFQIAVVLVQKDAPPEHVGVATATANLVRQVGVTLGSAVIGSSMGGAVVGSLTGAGLPGGARPGELTPEALGGASDAVRSVVAAAYADAMAPVLLGLSALYLIGLGAAVMLPRGQLTDDAAEGAVGPR